MSNHPNRNRIVRAANGDEYHIRGERGAYEVGLWNARFRAWISDFAPQFPSVRAAREYIADRINLHQIAGQQ